MWINEIYDNNVCKYMTLILINMYIYKKQRILFNLSYYVTNIIIYNNENI